MWVQLKSIQYVTEHGAQVTKYPGDWVNVGKQTALLWIQKSAAVLPSRTQQYAEFDIIEGSGVLIVDDFTETKDNPHPQRGTFGAFPELEVNVGARCLLYKRNVLWQPTVKLRLEFVPTGLMLLDTWQIALPLWDYDQLATHTGSNEDKQLTHETVGDLRIPLYDTRLMFVRRDQDTDRLFARWDEEQKKGSGDEKHSFLRALYRTPLLVLALPLTWTNPNVN